MSKLFSAAITRTMLTITYYGKIMHTENILEIYYMHKQQEEVVQLVTFFTFDLKIMRLSGGAKEVRGLRKRYFLFVFYYLRE